MRGMDGYMRGVNLGGWLSQFDAPTKEHFDTFITEDDIRRIAGLGLDHVRVPVDYTVIETEDGEPVEEGYQYIDNCVRWCRENGLHMILDIHKTYGYSFDPLDKDDKTIFFTDPGRQKRFLDMWRTIAKRYCEDTDVVAYELLNEIVAVEVKDLWNDIALRASEAIREPGSSSAECSTMLLPPCLSWPTRRTARSLIHSTATSPLSSHIRELTGWMECLWTSASATPRRWRSTAKRPK